MVLFGWIGKVVSGEDRRVVVGLVKAGVERNVMVG